MFIDSDFNLCYNVPTFTIEYFTLKPYDLFRGDGGGDETETLIGRFALVFESKVSGEPIAKPAVSRFYFYKRVALAVAAVRAGHWGGNDPCVYLSVSQGTIIVNTV